VRQGGIWLNQDEVWSTHPWRATRVLYTVKFAACLFRSTRAISETRNRSGSASLVDCWNRDGRPERRETAMRATGDSRGRDNSARDLVARVHEIPWNGILWKSTGLLEGSRGLRRGLYRDCGTTTLRPHHPKSDAKNPICQQYSKRHRTHSCAHQHKQIQ
jgi:hypothetical protein